MVPRVGAVRWGSLHSLPSLLAHSSVTRAFRSCGTWMTLNLEQTSQDSRPHPQLWAHMLEDLSCDPLTWASHSCLLRLEVEVCNPLVGSLMVFWVFTSCFSSSNRQQQHDCSHGSCRKRFRWFLYFWQNYTRIVSHYQVLSSSEWSQKLKKKKEKKNSNC